MIKAADMMIARRADTKARADFATWKMMAKLNGAGTLPAEARGFLDSYKALLEHMSEAEATEAAIKLVYKSYYAEMGGVGVPPDVRSSPGEGTSDNVMAFKRPPARPPKAKNSGTDARPRLPVALIFVCLVVVYAGIRYLLR